MDWSRGYTSHWRVYEVDPETWADAGLIEGVTSAAVERDGSGNAPLLESGAIRLDAEVGDTFRERYLRLALYAEQDGGAERVDIATLLYTSTAGTVDKHLNAIELVGRSVLHPAATKQLLVGSYAPKGVDGALWAARMLRDAIQAPVEVAGSFTLETNVVFDAGMYYLESVWQILDAGNFIMQIDGDGAVRIMPRPTEPTMLLDEAGARLLHPSIKYELDWSDVPNRYTAVEGSQSATVTNDDAGSVTSTIARGYIHDERDTSPTRVNGESLTQYAARKLEEASTIPDVRIYSREYRPDVYPFSVARGTLASVELEGDLRIITQSLQCDKGIVVQEKAQREVKLWQR